MCGNVFEIGQPVGSAWQALPIIPDRKVLTPCSLPRVMMIALARASMLFSTNSAMAFKGFAWESAMMRMAFQSSPIRNFPFSERFVLFASLFTTARRPVDT